MRDSDYIPSGGWKPLTPIMKWPLLGVELEVEANYDKMYLTYRDGCDCVSCREYRDTGFDNGSSEPNNIETIDELIENKYNQWLVTKEDGSLENGIELVSVPMQFKEHRRKWPSVLNLLRKNKVECNDGTGLHIHIETPVLPPQRTNQVLLCNKKLIQKIAGRDSEEYCEWPNKYYDDFNCIDDCHYGVINKTEYFPIINSNNSVYEFRAPQATLNLKEFLGRVQLPITLTKFILETDRPPNQFHNYIKNNHYIRPLL